MVLALLSVCACVVVLTVEPEVVVVGRRVSMALAPHVNEAPKKATVNRSLSRARRSNSANDAADREIIAAIDASASPDVEVMINKDKQYRKVEFIDRSGNP
jgi:hypothetical protein